METIPVIFASSWKPFSIVIRLFTWSKWSHCGAITPDGKFVIESAGGIGVREIPLGEFKARYPQWQIAQMPVKDRRDAYQVLRGEIGKPYDYSGVFGIVFRRNWQLTDAWFCSELLAAASGLFRRNYIGRITQEDVWRLTF